MEKSIIEVSGVVLIVLIMVLGALFAQYKYHKFELNLKKEREEDDSDSQLCLLKQSMEAHRILMEDQQKKVDRLMMKSGLNL